LLNKAVYDSLETAEIIRAISHEPRKILGLPVTQIEKGVEANFTLFNPDLEWEFSENDISSKSRNTPFIGTQLKGKALAIYNHGHLENC